MRIKLWQCDIRKITRTSKQAAFKLTSWSLDEFLDKFNCCAKKMEPELPANVLSFCLMRFTRAAEVAHA